MYEEEYRTILTEIGSCINSRPLWPSKITLPTNSAYCKCLVAVVVTSLYTKLKCRNKWIKRRENLSVGDIVLIIDNLTSRSKWNMDIVEEIYPGKDGLVRSARIRSKSGIHDRPITKLCHLLSKDEIEQN